MSNDLRRDAREMADVTRRLSELNLDLMKEGIATTRRTWGTIARSREILDSCSDRSIARSDDNEYPAPLPHESGERDVVVNPMPIIVIGGSAGSQIALRAVIDRMPDFLTAAIFIVQHSSPDWHTAFSAELLQTHTGLRVHVICDSQPFYPRNIYLCPSNHHLALEDGVMRIEKSPIENHTRPSIDVTFRSAAAGYGRRVIGVLLSGILTDGTAGLWQIKKRGGIAIVQAPTEAEHPGMPRSAIANVAVDYVLCASGIGDKLVELVEQRRSRAEPTPECHRILIVEDELLVAQNLLEHLDELSYSICDSVRSGEDAVTAATKTSPDLILMDIKLAGRINGVEAARQSGTDFKSPLCSSLHMPISRHCLR
jgi:chemotaxis response regulator CheB